MSNSEPPILIIGGGIVGMGIAWRLVRAGRAVTVFERGEVGREASWAAAGMLAPDAEIGYEEPELYAFGLESLRRWERFAGELQEASGVDVDFRTEGTLLVADDRDAAAALRRLYDFMVEQALDVAWLTGAEALELEPFLAPRLAGAVSVPTNYAVDNRRVMEALETAVTGGGGTVRTHTPVRSIEPDDTRPAVVTEDGERVEGAAVVLAAGAWSRRVEGLPEDARPPVRPVKGQVIELQVTAPFDLRHVVRGPGAYLVPKKDGRLVVGATSEEMGFDTDVTAGGLFRLLEGAWEVVPGIYDLPVRQSYVGLRPASRDHRPLLGRTDAPGVVVATGHYRHGILHAPVTAEEVAHLILEGETSEWLRPFSPRRFTR